MSERPDPVQPGPHDDVPDDVLEELHAAFSGEGDQLSLDDVEPTFGATGQGERPTAKWPSPDLALPPPPPPGREPSIEPTIDWLGEPIFGEGAPPAPEPTGVLEVDLDDTSASLEITVAHSADDATVVDADVPSPPTAGGRATIVIADDDLPDAVYLDEESELRLRETHSHERASSDNVVFIDDVDGVDFSEPVVDTPTRSTARSSGGIDPRVRARRVAVRRAEGRRRLFWVSLVGGLLLLVVISAAVVASPLFGVDEVVVQGAVYTDRDVLDDVTADLDGAAVLLVDTEAIEQRLSEVPWVERVRVQSLFPHTVLIDIRERRPLATFQGSDGRWRVIDVQGRVLDVLDGQPIAYMPITGTHPDTARGQFAGAPYASVAGLVEVLPPEIRALTTSIGLDAVSGTLTMTLKGGLAVRLGSSEDLDLKLARLLGQVRGGLDGVVSLDVSTAQIGVVRE